MTAKAHTETVKDFDTDSLAYQLATLRREIERLHVRIALLEADRAMGGDVTASPLKRLETVITRNLGPITWGRCRAEQYCRPRRWFMWLATMHGHTSVAIGKHCQRDHGTVLHQVKRVEQEIEAERMSVLASRLLAESECPRKF